MRGLVGNDCSCTPSPGHPGWLMPESTLANTYKLTPTFGSVREAHRLAGPWPCLACDSQGCPAAWMEEEKAGIQAGRTELGSC